MFARRSRARRRKHAPAEVEVSQGDALTGDGLALALDGVEVAYYLIHSMEHTAAENSHFAERERTAAENFAAAAAVRGCAGSCTSEASCRAGASSGRQSTRRRTHSSRHLASREEVERILLEAVADSLALRASIVIGARSRSFRLLVHLRRAHARAHAARLAQIPHPADRRAGRDAMLAACATTPLTGRSLDIGGPDVLSYGEMLSDIAELMVVNRPAIRLAVNLTGITARVAAAIAGEDPELVVPLMEGLQGDLLPAEDRAAELLGMHLHSFDSAVEHALAEWEAFEPLAAR